MTRTEVNIAAIADVVKNGHRIASRMIAESLNIPKTVVLRILKENVGKRKLCARFVSHSLIPEQREDRVTSCQDIIAMAEVDKFSFTKIITGDETWCFAYDPETKRKSSEWVGETSPRPKKLKFQRSRIKNMLIILFDYPVVVRKNSYQREEQKMQNFISPEAHSTGSSSCVLLPRFFFCTIMRPPTKLQVFANF